MTSTINITVDISAPETDVWFVTDDNNFSYIATENGYSATGITKNTAFSEDLYMNLLIGTNARDYHSEMKVTGNNFWAGKYKFDGTPVSSWSRGWNASPTMSLGDYMSDGEASPNYYYDIYYYASNKQV